MATLRDRLTECDVAIRGRLDPSETIIATGRCEDITDLGSVDSGGGGWTYVMVTARRLRWVPRSLLRFEAALDLDEVTRAVEETRGHRYGITLDHAPLVRRHTVPAHRFLMWRWGNAERSDVFRETRLAFSRADTAVAVALRTTLAIRNAL